MAPSEVFVGFCTPTSCEQFRGHLRGRATHHYARMVTEGREAFFHEVLLKPYEQFARAVTPTGARVIPEVTLAGLQSILADPACRCLILVAHSHDDCVEMSDRLVPMTEFVAAIPHRYTGILDLSVCDASELASALRAAHPGLGPIKFSRSKVRYDVWLLFYSILIRTMAETHADYWDLQASITRRIAEDAGDLAP